MIKARTKTSRIPQASKIPSQMNKQMTKTAAKQTTLIQIPNQNNLRIRQLVTNKLQKRVIKKMIKAKRLIRQQMDNSRQTMELASMVTSLMANPTKIHRQMEIQESLGLLNKAVKRIKDNLLMIK